MQGYSPTKSFGVNSEQKSSLLIDERESSHRSYHAVDNTGSEGDMEDLVEEIKRRKMQEEEYQKGINSPVPSHQPASRYLNYFEIPIITISTHFLSF